MAVNGDPWRILGLTPGASLDDVRRAYRRLAKANHPDAAGETALPRFLAIQAAYEQIAGIGRSRRPGARPGSSSRSAGAGADAGQAARQEPWRADPDRARAAGRADGRRPGARPSGRPGAGGTAPGGATRDRPASGGGAADASAGRAGSGSRSRRSSTGRPPKTATPYSTSYDAADEEPFEPGWSGATWYGSSSGTYWTINPKEYADPRKHGPEYQARARRARGGSIPDDETPETPEAGPAGSPDGAEPAEDADPAFARPRDAESSTGPTIRGQARTRPAPEPPQAARPAPRRAASRVGSQPGAPTSAPRAASWRAPGDPPFGGDPPPPSRAASTTGGGFHGPFLPHATTPSGRLAMALLGWPPLGLFAAAAIGESTGCGRYAASCAELSSPGTWIVSIAILLLLLAAPAVAAWSAHGTIAALLIGVPSAVILSAAGGTNLPQASGPLLLGVLAIAYLAGVAYAVAGRRLALSG